ncbi:hypothetical protein EXIGLDRAFT_604662 [Exidia glandulosa HHB12029]|uniref:Uncharacterized protein n=1 Tax=Exidia glandulosa HHB12029 TaxID=1314781 RepID=A0A165N6K8_EXIGL|nr:hypothetical protein EXIGLDRAFT_604662 [Exidia glandulosa HHB12029]
MASASTSSILSHSHAVLKSKRRAKQNQIKEIVFDDDARKEFLTGFHKRKLQRTEEKKSKAIAREKQQRLETRKESRQALAEQAKENAAAVERALGANIGSDDEDDDFASRARKLEDEMEFEGEEQLATVTVVEDFTTDDLILGPRPTRAHDDSSRESTPRPRPKHQEPPSSSTTKPSKPKPREQKFRYETKAARRASKDKQKAARASKGAYDHSSSSRSTNKKSTNSKRKR